MWSAQAVRDSKKTTLNAIYPPWAEPEARKSAVGWHWNTESSKYYARQQTAVVRGLGWLARCLSGRQTAATRKHSLCFLVQFPSNCHVHQRTFAKWRR